jgi:abortive infection bacteriophage resistance protein
MSKFFSGMAVADKERVAARFGVPQWDVMESWLRTLNYVRNVVAHHSRLWNRNVIDQPKLPRPGVRPEFDPLRYPEIISRLYVVLCMLACLLRTVSPNSSWARRVRETAEAFPKVGRRGSWRDGISPGLAKPRILGGGSAGDGTPKPAPPDATPSGVPA